MIGLRPDKAAKGAASRSAKIRAMSAMIRSLREPAFFIPGIFD
jgi:hypothetical protein